MKATTMIKAYLCASLHPTEFGLKQHNDRFGHSLFLKLSIQVRTIEGRVALKMVALPFSSKGKGSGNLIARAPITSFDYQHPKV